MLLRTPRRSAALVAVLSFLLTLVVVPPAPARAADAASEDRFVALANQERARHGLPALQVASDLRAVARRHSARMAQQQRLHHNPNVGSEVGGYRRVGENVGYGPSVDHVHGAFMRSSAHRGNILSPHFTQIGVGVEWRDGTLWVTQVFRQPSGGAAPAPAPPPPAPSTPKKAAPRTAPTAAPEPPPPPPPPPPASTRLRLVFARVESQDSGTQVANLVPEVRAQDPVVPPEDRPVPPQA